MHTINHAALGLRQTLEQARSEVHRLRAVASAASLHKQYCLDVADASDACLQQLEQSLAASSCPNDPDDAEQLVQLMPAASKLLLATRSATRRVKELAQPTGIRRLLAWGKRRAYKDKLLRVKCEMAAARDYAAAMAAAVALEKASAGERSGAGGNGQGFSMAQAAALAVINFEPGVLRHGAAKDPVAAVRFMPTLRHPASGADGREAALLLLVQLAPGHVEVHSPSVRGFHSSLALGKPGSRLSAIAVNWAAQTLWTCYSDGNAVRTQLGEQKAEPYACSHAAITCAHAVPGALWMGDAAGRVVCLQGATSSMVRVVTSRGARHAMSAVTSVWAHAHQPSVAVAADADGWLALIDAQHFSVADTFNCDAFGSATCIASVPWGSEAAGAGWRSPLPAVEFGWRLLTGHSSGVLVLWELAGSALRPMSVFGEHAAPIRGLAVLPELAMLVSGHRDGLLRVWPLPCPRMHLLPLPHGRPQRWSLRHGVVRTRHARLVSLDRCGTRLATASEAGDVTVWDVLDLRAQALRQGASFCPFAQSTSQAACGAAGAAPLASAALPPTSLPLHLQLAASHIYSELQRAPAFTPQPHPPSAAAAAAASQPGAAQSLQGASGAFPPGVLPPGLATAGLGGPLSPTALDSALLQEYLRRSAAACLGGGGGASAVGQAAAAGVGGTACQAQQLQGLYFPGGMQGLDAQALGLQPVQVSMAAAGGGAAGPMWAVSAPQADMGAAGVLGAGNLYSVPEEEAAGTGDADGPGGEAFADEESYDAAALQALKSQLLKASDMQLLEPMGDGDEVRMWRGSWRHTPVAVQELQASSPAFDVITALGRELGDCDDATPRREFWALLEDLRCLTEVSQHPCVVRLVGVCLEPPRVVTEYYAGGSLRSLMDRARADDPSARSRLQWMDRLAMLHDVAAGMAFLHDRGFVHGELMPSHVFLTAEGRARVGGLGFAQLQCSAGAQGNRVSPTHWLAPEAALTQQCSFASDVYSFATIAYELITCLVPGAALTPRQLDGAQGSYQDLWFDGRMPQMGYASGSFNSLKQLVAECWAPRPEDRPSFSYVVEQLQVIVDCEQAVLTMRANVSTLLAQRSNVRDSPRRTGTCSRLGMEQPISVSERVTPIAPPSGSRRFAVESASPRGSRSSASVCSGTFAPAPNSASTHAGGCAAARDATPAIAGHDVASPTSAFLTPPAVPSMVGAPSTGAGDGLLSFHPMLSYNPSQPNSSAMPGSGFLDAGVGSCSSGSAAAGAPTFDMLIAGASGVQRFTGLPVALGRSRISRMASGGPMSAAAHGRLSAHDIATGGVPAEARLERLATAGLAEAAAEVLQTVMGASRRTTAMQTDTGQVILLLEETSGEAGEASASGEAVAEGPAPDGPATSVSTAGSAEQADQVPELPTLLQHAPPLAQQHRVSAAPSSLHLSVPPPPHDPQGSAAGGDSPSPVPSPVGPSPPSFASTNPAARRILGAANSRRSNSTGSGVVVALASLQGGGVSFKGGVPNLGKGNLSLKGMSSLAAAVKTFPVEVVSALLSWAPSPGQSRRTYSSQALSDGLERSAVPSPSASAGRLSPVAVAEPAGSTLRPSPAPQA